MQFWYGLAFANKVYLLINYKYHLTGTIAYIDSSGINIINVSSNKLVAIGSGPPDSKTDISSLVSIELPTSDGAITIK